MVPSRSIVSAPAAIAVLLLYLAVSPLAAQERGDATAIGMSRSTVAIARGISSLYSSVGSIALDDLGPRDSVSRLRFELAALPLGLEAGATFLNRSDLEFVFGNKDCDVFSDADRLRLHDLLAPNRMSVDGALDIFALRVQVPGILAFGVQYGHRLRARMNFPEQFRNDVMGNGDVYAGGKTYGGADVGGEWTKRIGFSIGSAWRRRALDTVPLPGWLPAVGFGININRIEGLAHFDVDPRSVVRTTALPPGPRGVRRVGVEGFYSFRTSIPRDFDPAREIFTSKFLGSDSNDANGWSVGFGISAVLYRTVRIVRHLLPGTPLYPETESADRPVVRDAVLFGIALDEIGALDWREVNQRRARTIDTIVTEQRGGLTYEVICGYRGQLDTIAPFRDQLPMQLRIGGGVDITAFVPEIAGDLFASIEGAFELNDAIGGEGAPRLGLGLSWRPWRMLTVNTGLQVGGRRGLGWAVGAGFHPWRWISLEAATSDWPGVIAGSSAYDVALRLATRIEM